MRQASQDQGYGRSRLVMIALAVGAAFGAVTSLVNALSHSFADLESRAYTTGGWSVAEIMSVLLDSGWAWAGLAVAVGALVTNAVAPARGAAAGALALIAATAAYSVMETVRGGGPLASWYETEPLAWWVTSVLFGAPLGAAGTFVRRPGVVGLLARLIVPVGAAVQMGVLPPGRNEVVSTIGMTVVWAAAAVSIGYFVVRFLRVARRAGAES
jgi:hypothetical protein